MPAYKFNREALKNSNAYKKIYFKLWRYNIKLNIKN
jgi:hypothetical protein